MINIKKYKSNIMGTFTYFIISIMLFMLPITLLMWTFINSDEVIYALFVFPVFFIVILFMIIFSNIINLIAWIFIKPTIYIYDNFFSYKNKNVKYVDVEKIVFDKGTVSKTGGGTPCSITFHRDNQILCEITSPSYIASMIIIKRCRNAKIILVSKFSKIVFSSMYIVALIIWLLMLFM